MKRFGVGMIVIAAVRLFGVPDAFADTAGPAIASGRANLTLGRSPLHFEPNLGQADGRVRFLARGQGYGIYITPTETILALATNGSGATDVLRMRLLGSNPQPVIAGADLLRGRSNYFIGNDPAKWQRSVPHYGSLLVQAVYPGIDLAYHGNPRQLEYDFLVAPGADPGRIQLRFDGFTRRRLDREGNLVLSTKAGTLVQKRPLAYQDIGGVRKPIESRYALVGRSEVRIVVGKHDRERPLVIDPSLFYATLLGGSGYDETRSVAVDAAGAIYVTGSTSFSTEAPFPTTAGAIQTTHGGPMWDVFISKIDPAGHGAADLVYSTYLGGNSDDLGWGIAVDAQGAAHVVGETMSDSFPTTPGAFQTSTIDGWDAFLVKLDPSGGLAYATRLGGGWTDEARGVALDPSGIVYITGQTRSFVGFGPFPVTAGAYQTTVVGNYDAFMVKLNPQGAGAADLLYSTLFGGPGPDLAQDVAVHGSTVYISGYTEFAGVPTTPGAYQPASAGQEDSFLAVFNPAGSGQSDLLYATNLGGAGGDWCFGLAIDASGAAYLGGYTTSGYAGTPGPFPTTAGAYQTSILGFANAFVTKINPAGAGPSDLVYSTYVGTDSAALGLALDEAVTVYLTGQAGPAFPTTPGAYQEAAAGEGDAFMLRLNPAGGGASDLLYSTFFGGPGYDFGYGIAVGGGVATVVGDTLAAIPTTPGAFQTENGGLADVFVARLATRPSVDLFLHGHGAMENSPTLFLDKTAPTETTARTRDSGAVKLASGNPWKAIGTWTGDPAVTTGTLLIERLDAWLGLKKSGDAGARFDIRAELFKNGSPMDSGELYCIEGVTYGSDSAKRVSVSFEPPASTAFDGTTDILSLQLLARLGTDGAGQPCGGPSSAAGLRLYFDGVSRAAVLSIMEP